MFSIVHHFISTYGYYAVFVCTALEGFGLFFIPGESSLIAAGIDAAGVGGGAQHLNIIYVLIVAFCGAVVGDNFSFWIGREYGFDLLKRRGHIIHLNLKRLKFVQYLYLRYGAPIVFIGRFVMLIRAWESFLAGANLMPWRKFAPVNAAAILAWVCAWGLGAYGLGKTSEDTLAAMGIGLFVLFVILFALGWLYFSRHEDELEEASEKALPGPLKARPEGGKGAKAAKAIAPMEYEKRK
ncbi:MAG: DedA family protein [Acetobacteraceae bacterium]